MGPALFHELAAMKRCISFCLLLGVCLCTYPQNYLRLMTYNVRNAKGLDGKYDFQRVANVILDVAPDVVAIQEADSMSLRNYNYLLGELAVRTRMYASYAPALHLGIGRYGVGVLSREEPLRVERVRLPGKEEKRVMLLVEFEDYVFCSTHLSLTEDDRMTSLDIIREYAEKSTKPFFLAGDLNALPESEFFARLNADYDVLNDVADMTYPAGEPNRTIDYITSWKPTGGKFAVVESRVVDERVASDHRPVVVTLRRAVHPDAILSAGPYLQSLANGGVSVSWVTNVPACSWVEYTVGDTSNLQCSPAQLLYDDGTVHETEVPLLASGDTLHFRVCSQEKLGQGRVGYTSKSPFHTFVIP